MSLQRMIVIPPDTFERWKNIVVEDKKLSDLDQEMKKILYNNKLNDIDKWHFYRQNLLRYLNAKQEQRQNINNFSKTNVITEAQKNLRDMDTQTKTVYYKHKTAQTLPTAQKSIGSQANFMEFIDDPPSTLDTSNIFPTLENKGDDIDGEDEIELDVSDIVREKALEGQSKTTKIFRERQSFDRDAYRVFDLNNGETVNVPVERQMITRAALKLGTLPDKSQTTIDFRNQKRKNSTTSTPTKSQPKSTTSWENYK